MSNDAKINALVKEFHALREQQILQYSPQAQKTWGKMMVIVYELQDLGVWL